MESNRTRKWTEQKCSDAAKTVSAKYGLPELISVQELQRRQKHWNVYVQLESFGHDTCLIAVCTFYVGNGVTARMVRARIKKAAPLFGKWYVDVTDNIAAIVYYRRIPPEFGYESRNAAFHKLIEETTNNIGQMAQYMYPYLITKKERVMKEWL